MNHQFVGKTGKLSLQSVAPQHFPQIAILHTYPKVVNKFREEVCRLPFLQTFRSVHLFCQRKTRKVDKLQGQKETRFWSLSAFLILISVIEILAKYAKGLEP